MTVKPIPAELLERTQPNAWRTTQYGAKRLYFFRVLDPEFKKVSAVVEGRFQDGRTRICEEVCAAIKVMVDALCNPKYRVQGSENVRPRINLFCDINAADTVGIYWSYAWDDTDPPLYPHNIQPNTGRSRTGGFRNSVVRIVDKWMDLTDDDRCFVADETLARFRKQLLLEMAEQLDLLLEVLASVADIRVLSWPVVPRTALTVECRTAFGSLLESLAKAVESANDIAEARQETLRVSLERAGFASSQAYQEAKQAAASMRFSRYLFETRGSRISALQLQKIEANIEAYRAAVGEVTLKQGALQDWASRAQGGDFL